MRGLELWAGWLSIAAAAVHGSVAPQHFQEWWGYGTFFVVAGLCQAMFGLAMITRGLAIPGWPWPRIRPVLVALGIAGNLAIMALWVVTRTVGIPALGPGAGQIEDVGAADATSKLLETALVLVLARLWFRAARDAPQPAAVA